MSLRTRVCDLLEIEVPILLAGMGGASVPKLAAAVSNAGGLGVLGAAGCSPNELRRWIEETRRLTTKPFGVDTLLPASVRREAAKGAGGPSPVERLPEYRKFAAEFMKSEGLVRASREEIAREAGVPVERDGPPPLTKEFFEAQMEVVCEERVPVYVAGLGNPGPWLDRLHANGTRVMAVVGAVRHARQVVESGIDLIVAQGHDGGGHNSPVGTMALVPQVVDAVAGRVPVIGAGGIGDGRGVAAALMLGAEGVWIGTRFLATDEAGIAPHQKDALVEGNEESTVVSRYLTGKPVRLLRNKLADAWARSGLEPLPMPFMSMISMPVVASATLAGRKDISPGIGGQGLGLIHQVQPAAEVLREIAREAEDALKRAPGLLR